MKSKRMMIALTGWMLWWGANVHGQTPEPAPATTEAADIHLNLLPGATPVDEATKTSVLSWVRRFQNVVYRMRIREFVEMVDVEQLAAAMFAGVATADEQRNRTTGTRALNRAFERSFPMMKDFFTFSDAEVRRIDVNGKQASVMARVHDGDGYEYKVRWWLQRDGNHWRMIDYENLTIRARLSVFLATGVQAMEGGGSKLAPAMPLFMKVAVAQEEGDYSGIMEHVAALEKFAMPPALREIVLMAKIGALAELGETEKVPPELDKLEAAAPDQPMLPFLRGAYHQESGEHAKAIPFLEKYAAAAGHDEDSWSMLTESLLKLERHEEARRVTRDWLADYPHSSEAAWTYWTCLPKPERVTGLRPHLETLSAKAERLTDFALNAELEEDWDALKLAVEVMKANKFDPGTVSEWEEALREGLKEVAKPEKKPEAAAPAQSKAP